MDELNRAAEEAKQRTAKIAALEKQIRDLVPAERITVSLLAKTAFTSNFYVLALAFLIFFLWGRISSLAEVALYTASPLALGILSNDILSVGQALFFPICAGTLWVLVARRKSPPNSQGSLDAPPASGAPNT
jgi:hypothetical protein